MVRARVRPHELGDLVRKASQHKGPWPKLSVWHGSVDRVVNPANADEIVKQWLDVHDLPAAPMSEGIVDGHPRQVWWNADGETVVESYTITDMAHGTPLGLADNDKRYGAQGAFLIEAGISSSYLIAKFFGLTNRMDQPERKAAAAEAAPGLAEREADPDGVADAGAAARADAGSLQGAVAVDDVAAAPEPRRSRAESNGQKPAPRAAASSSRRP